MSNWKRMDFCKACLLVSLHIRQPWNANLQLHSAVCKIYRLVTLRKCDHSKIIYLPSNLEMGSELANYKSFVFALVTRFFADHNNLRDHFLFWFVTELQWKWSKVLKKVIMNHRFLQKLKNYEENVIESCKCILFKLAFYSSLLTSDFGLQLGKPFVWSYFKKINKSFVDVLSFICHIWSRN